MPKPYLPQNSASFFVVQKLMADRRSICLYEGDLHVPLCITTEISREDCEELFDRDEPVTFTCRVPLEHIVEGVQSMQEYIANTAFEFPVDMRSCEFRPVGATIGDFSGTTAGDVLIQVTCSIHLSA